jgi:hypothetical protein
MERDRETIGLTPESQAIIANIEARGWFMDGQDAARFCMAYAIRAKVPAGVTPGTDTRWAAGNFDKSGEIRLLLAALYPACETPVRLMEHLVNEGLRMVAERVKSESVAPADLMD